MSPPRKPTATVVAKPPTPRRTVDVLERELRRAYGLVSVVAERLGMSRQALYRRIRKSERLQEALRDAREIVVDTAELKLIEAIRKGEPWAIGLALKTLGKERGYVERQEVDNLRDVDLSRLSTEELRAWLDRLRR